MLQNSILVFIMMFTGVKSLVAQHPDPALMNDREYARYCIDNLKDGSLVVRLNFKTKAINYLVKQGNTAGAEHIRQEQFAENTAIMDAFVKYYKFCPVYFISFDSTIALQHGMHQGIFLNENLKVDPGITMKKSFFLVAESGMLETSIPEDQTQPNQEEVRRGTFDDALVIRNKDLDMLRDPFPYYVHYGNWEDRVKKLSKRLQKFYQRNH